jgi:flavin-binding protein dodecin
MAESVYKIIEVVGTSPESWEKAATAAVNRAAKTLRDLRVAEIVQLDMQILSREGKALLQVRRLGRRSLAFLGSHETSCMPRLPLRSVATG